MRIYEARGKYVNLRFCIQVRGLHVIEILDLFTFNRFINILRENINFLSVFENNNLAGNNHQKQRESETKISSTQITRTFKHFPRSSVIELCIF